MRHFPAEVQRYHFTKFVNTKIHNGITGINTIKIHNGITFISMAWDYHMIMLIGDYRGL